MRAESNQEAASVKLLFKQALAILAFGSLMFFLISLLVVASYQIWYSGRIFPGISVQGIGVGGMTIRQAEAHLNKEMRLTPNGKIVLWHSDNRIEVEPAQIGIHLDTRSSAQSAFDFGRRGSIGAWLVENDCRR